MAVFDYGFAFDASESIGRIFYIFVEDDGW